jgi:uncharacterized iron-regulated protein
MNKFILSLALIISINTFGQTKDAYKIYKINGRKTSYRKLLKECKKADMVFFGEEHDNPVAHWLEIELTKDLHKKAGKPIILAAEMMEADNQKQVDLYLKDSIDYKTFKKEARLWPNFKTDYKPLLDYAKKYQLTFVASNVPRRYASKVYHGGFKVLDSLPAEEKQWIAPLPIKYDKNLSQYKKMIEMMGGHGGDNLPKAQAIKDATMAYNILKYYKKGSLLIHYNGSFHSNVHQGIIWYIRLTQPDLKIVTITVEAHENVKKLDKKHKGKADFIIATDKDFPSSY